MRAVCVTVRRLIRNGYDVVECDRCLDSTTLSGRPEWRNEAEDAFRFKHPDEAHEPPSLQPKPRKKR